MNTDNLKINAFNQNKTGYNKSLSYKGVLDGVITNGLRTLNTNPMANAVGIDLFAMVGPRTYVDTKERNKYAGAETFFREFTGTLIVCLSASYLAKGIAHLANKIIKPDTLINPNSWLSKSSIDLLEESWNTSRNTSGYVDNVLNGVSGVDGKQVNKYQNIDWENVNWVDEKSWDKISWDNPEYKSVHHRLKTKESVTSLITKIIEDKDITKKDRKNLLTIASSRVVNALGVETNVSVKLNDKKLETSVPNLLRDVVDMGKDVFKNTGVENSKAINKLHKINGIKSLGALAVASTLGLTNQYINRKITEKRTGTKGFVGDTNYTSNVTNKTSNKDNSIALLVEKFVMSAGMAAMALGVMRVKSPKDFMKKLEFTGPVTSGNAIKTVYASTLIGRFMASDSQDELRETSTRDYLGFLNWLVFGGFAAKGAANLLDPKRKNLFNQHKEGKGIRYWLNDLSLKSHNEIASKGTNFAKKNMWKLNIAQGAGLLYSTVALGVLLPKLNIFITNRKQKTMHNKPENINSSTNIFEKNKDNKYESFNRFKQVAKSL
ncbi:MAG: hypothetical protein K6E29_09085 [Cyanobacteria bacterium RUI128]|nr:hypothetical protein [Cyanobacteria bacterium RUI128]